MLPQCYPNYKTVHRRFQHWCQNEVLRDAMTKPANALRDEGALNESERFIDATFASARGGGAEIGPTKRGKGTNLWQLWTVTVCRWRLAHTPTTIMKSRGLQLSFDFCMIEAKPENIIGDRAYDSDKLDEELRQEGIEMISPHRRGRVKPKTQDGR